MAGDWTEILAIGDLPEGKPVRVAVNGLELLVFRTGDRILAASNRCTHQGAPLHRGIVGAIGSVPTVTCPVHGSTYHLTDGRVIHGPATDPLPVYEIRTAGGAVEVRVPSGTA